MKVLVAARAPHAVVLFCCLAATGTPSRAQDQTPNQNSSQSPNPPAVGNPPQTPEATRGSQQNPTPVEAGQNAGADAGQKAEETTEAPPATTLSLGGDLYYGRSNLEGFKHLRDGFWAAGSGLAYPSILSLRLTLPNDSEAKLAFGVGDLYRDDASTLHQPHEAWYRMPIGKTNLTVGKFYVPFGLQEWQYETKWGAMLEGKSGQFTYAASANYNQNASTPNAYFRLGRNFGENLNVGVSLAAGKGLSYDALFDRAAALDLTASRNGWSLYGEALTMRRKSDERFNFSWLKLQYEKLGKFKPFISHYQWHDTTDSFGTYRSTSIGASYNLLPSLALEGGFARTSDPSNSNVTWIQLHWTPEYALYKKERVEKDQTARGASTPDSTNSGPPLSGIPPQLLPRHAP